ncbi:MAG: substrate-binding domain-containing protein [Clostridia bacterium]
MITLEKLAKVTGVSRATIDRVIHNRPSVKEKTRKKVLKAIEEIGYTPNSIGKALALQKKLNFGIIISADLMPEDNTLFSYILEGMQLCMKRLENTGVNFIIERMNTGSETEQIEAIYHLIELGVTGIALSPEGKGEEILRALAYAREKGIVVVCYYNDIKGENYDYFVGSDSIREGKVSAELLEKFIDSSAKVAIFSGLLKNNVHQTRMNSAVEKIKADYSHIDVVQTITGSYTENIAYNLCIEIIEKYPDLKGIIASCGGISGIMTALKEKNKLDKIKIIFFDFTRKAQYYLKEGTIDALIGVDLTRLGYNTIKALYEKVLYGYIDDMELFEPMLIKTKECL